MNKLISVIIPTSDSRSRYLKRAIESVEEQDYRNLEIIVVIDGKSEESKKLITNLNLTLSIRIIETHDRVGGSEARNIGVREANGDLIALLDDDDEWYKDKIASQIKLMEKKGISEHDDFLCFTSLHRYKQITDLKYQKIPNIDYEDSGKIKISDYLFETKGLRNIGFIQTSTVLVPKRLLMETPFTKGLVKHQDWDWLLRLDNEHKLKIIQVIEPKIIYHSDIPAEKRVGYINRWRFTEEWATQHRNLFSQQGYESFILNYIIMGIASDKQMKPEERRREITQRLKSLTWRTRISPYAFKIWVYRLKEGQNK